MIEFNTRVRVNDSYPIVAWHGREGIVTMERYEDHVRYPYTQVAFDGSRQSFEFEDEELDIVEVSA